jgi:hypothetical protein
MDESVLAGMARWPDVPACYAWLALDRRGRWRMRDEPAQQHGLPGDLIRNEALRGFIDRNYLSDDHGAWYFQNGPQRVYVDLEAAPYVLMFDNTARYLVTHNGLEIEDICAVLMDEDGNFWVDANVGFALVCDRDLANLLQGLGRRDGSALDAVDVLALVQEAPPALTLSVPLKRGVIAVPVTAVRSARLARDFGFVQKPRGTEASSRLV